MTQELRNMRIRQVSLVDKGASGRTFALLKRDTGDRSARNVRKDAPTFASLQASREIGTWLPEALYTLGEVIDAVLRPPSAAVAGEPAVTADQRLRAVVISCDEFKVELVTRVGQALALVLEADASAVVAKKGAVAERGRASLRGLL